MKMVPGRLLLLVVTVLMISTTTGIDVHGLPQQQPLPLSPPGKPPPPPRHKTTVSSSSQKPVLSEPELCERACGNYSQTFQYHDGCYCWGTKSPEKCDEFYTHARLMQAAVDFGILPANSILIHCQAQGVFDPTPMVLLDGVTFFTVYPYTHHFYCRPQHRVLILRTLNTMPFYRYPLAHSLLGNKLIHFLDQVIALHNCEEGCQMIIDRKYIARATKLLAWVEPFDRDDLKSILKGYRDKLDARNLRANHIPQDANLAAVLKNAVFQLRISTGYDGTNECKDEENRKFFKYAARAKSFMTDLQESIQNKMGVINAGGGGGVGNAGGKVVGETVGTGSSSSSSSEKEVKKLLE